MFSLAVCFNFNILNNKQSINFIIYTSVQSSVLWVKLHLWASDFNSLAPVCCRKMAIAIYIQSLLNIDDLEELVSKFSTHSTGYQQGFHASDTKSSISINAQD